MLLDFQKTFLSPKWALRQLIDIALLDAVFIFCLTYFKQQNATDLEWVGELLRGD